MDYFVSSRLFFRKLPLDASAYGVIEEVVEGLGSTAESEQALEEVGRLHVGICHAILKREGFAADPLGVREILGRLAVRCRQFLEFAIVVEPLKIGRHIFACEDRFELFVIIENVSSERLDHIRFGAPYAAGKEALARLEMQIIATVWRLSSAMGRDNESNPIFVGRFVVREARVAIDAIHAIFHCQVGCCGINLLHGFNPLGCENLQIRFARQPLLFVRIKPLAVIVGRESFQEIKNLLYVHFFARKS